MYKFIRWYNQNRMLFFLIIIVIIFAFAIIQTLNTIAEQEQKKTQISKVNSSTNQSTTISKTNESIITKDKISNQNDKTNTNLIKNFVDYCNDKNPNSAYDMLSDECKALLYPRLEDFINNYYNNIFYISRMYSLKNWYDSGDKFTYYIKYTEDVLATGNANSKDNKADYITVVKRNGEYKLNISSYVGRISDTKISQNENVQIKINYIDVYMDYTIANVDVKNSTYNDICIDPKENSDSLYAYDENNVKYTAFLNELALEQLIVHEGRTNNLNIKFNMVYNSERELSGIYFTNLILNYYGEKEKIVINVE